VGQDSRLTYLLSCSFLGLSSSGQMSLRSSHVAPPFLAPFFLPMLLLPDEDSSDPSASAELLELLSDSDELSSVGSLFLRLLLPPFFLAGSSSSDEAVLRACFLRLGRSSSSEDCDAALLAALARFLLLPALSCRASPAAALVSAGRPLIARPLLATFLPARGSAPATLTQHYLFIPLNLCCC